MSQEQSQSRSSAQDNDCYEVAAILDKKLMKRDGKLKNFYLIHWKGYPNECDHTWEPPENLKEVKDMIYEFEKRRRANPPGEESHRRGLDLNKLKQTQVPEDSENSKEKGDTRDSDSAPQKLRKLRKLQVPSSNKQQTDKNNHSLNKSDKKNEAKKKLEGKLSKNIKDIQKQTNKQATRKRTNPSRQQSQQSIYNVPPTKQPMQKAQSCKYGNIVNHCFQNGEMYYEVQMLTKEGSVKGISVIVASKIKGECSRQIADYLQKYIIQLEEWNRQLQA